MELPWKSRIIMCIHPWIVRWPLPHCCSVRQAIANMAKVGKMLNLIGFVTLREYLNNTREARIPANKFPRVGVSVKISLDFLSCRIFSVCCVAHADAREATGCWCFLAPDTRHMLQTLREHGRLLYPCVEECLRCGVVFLQSPPVTENSSAVVAENKSRHGRVWSCMYHVTETEVSPTC